VPLPQDQTSDDDYRHAASTPVAAAALLLGVFASLAAVVFLPGPKVSASDIRVRNATPFELSSVESNGTTYGEISSGGATLYRSMKVAYPHASFKLVAHDEPINMQLEDHAGEAPLGSGRFTYVITSEDSAGAPEFTIHAERE